VRAVPTGFFEAIAFVKLGVISDTHRLMRPEALAALEGSELIIHSGDVGTPDVLAALEAIAPVHAIRGNIDTASWARGLPEQREVQVESVRIWVLHDLHQLALDPAAEGYRAVISGHSHQPRIAQNNGVLYLNPGSAGPRRFRLPVTVARCEVHGDTIRAELVELKV
jgi:putative phosphoesterase